MSSAPAKSNGHAPLEGGRCPPTVADLAARLKLDANWLLGLGLRNVPRGVSIAYRGPEDEEEPPCKLLTLPEDWRGAEWPLRTPPRLYGEWLLPFAESKGALFLFLREPSCLVAWHHQLPALGFPDARAADALEDRHLAGARDVLVYHEPSAGGDDLIANLKDRLERLGHAGEVREFHVHGVLNLAELHALCPDRRDFFRQVKEAILEAVPLGQGHHNNGKATADARQANRQTKPENFCNFALVEGAGRGGPVKQGLPVGAIGQQLGLLTDGWPRLACGRLFAEGPCHEPLWIESADDLFAWVGRQLPDHDGNALQWVTGPDKVGRGEFVAYLRQTAPRYDALETMPHWPPMPRTYYLHPPLEGGDGRALDALLKRFHPATDADAGLIESYFLSPFWGGAPGKRPAYLIEAEENDRQGGRGTGKTKLAQAVAHLAGGHIDIRPSEDMDKVMTRLLSTAALGRRIALLDNVKTLRFSWADLEGAITSDVLSGKALYIGEGQRPNTLTWTITLNNASLSRDMAQRCVIVRLKRPPRDPCWEAETWEFIDEHRWAIVGDIIAKLKAPAPDLERYSRWSAWEREVLARVRGASHCQEVIEARQGEVDDDKAEADLVREAFVNELRRRGHDPSTAVVWIPAATAAEVLNAALGEKIPVNRASIHLKTLSVPELRKSDHNGVRGWSWRGESADPAAVLDDLNPRLEDGPRW
jgi:hypothetical protein